MERSGGLRLELGDAEQVVGCPDEAQGEVRLSYSLEARLAEEPDHLGPAEDLLDSSADALAERVARVARGAPVDRWLVALDHRYVRCDVALAQGGDEIARVVAALASQRQPLHAGGCARTRCSRVARRRPARCGPSRRPSARRL